MSLEGILAKIQRRARSPDSLYVAQAGRGSGAAACVVRQIVSQVLTVPGPTSLSIFARILLETVWSGQVSGRSNGCSIGVVVLAAGQDHPQDARVLVGDGHQGLVVTHASVQGADPLLQP